MSDIIKLLPDSVANQIAAGEVIQRPSSVLKELVENAVDAHATEIQIVIKDAGRSLIQVVDDGMGMSPTDARLAFERHSTSKIHSANDLFSLHTMGFRGEALASIAAIAHVTLRTRTRDSELGTKLEINASVCEGQEVDFCPVGANFMVKDLFFNIPARRKFLKSNNVELSNLVKEFEKLALINPEIAFKFTHDEKMMYNLQPGTFKQRIKAVFGTKVDNQLIPIKVETSIAKISGFVSHPRNAKKRNYLQYLFANGRYMRHPYYHKAIISTFEQLIPADTQPSYFLVFEVAPETIDVNIHPTKTEIKFEDEQSIWQLLNAAIREALGKYGDIPSIEFDNENAPSIPPTTAGKTYEQPSIEIDTSYNPFQSTRNTTAKSTITNWEKLYENFSQQTSSSQPPMSSGTKSQIRFQSQMSILDSGINEASCFQFQTRYIVTKDDNQLLVIDQHRAHLCILYEQYFHEMHELNGEKQHSIFPEEISLTKSQLLILQEIQSKLQSIGFELSIGENSVLILATPAILKDIDYRQMIIDAIDGYTPGGTTLDEYVRHLIALFKAKSNCIGYGQRLSASEMISLIEALQALNTPNYTPEGKPTMVKYPISVIETKF